MCDVVVVGSGFGGAATACRLVQAGFSVQVLERGRRYEQGDFPPLPIDSVLAPDLQRWGWEQSHGLWEILDLKKIVSVQAAGYGGGSLVYANVHLRPQPDVFDQNWPAEYRDPRTLEPFYDLAAYMMDVAPITAHPALTRDLAKADQMARAAASLGRGEGRGFFYPPLAISRTDGDNKFGIRQGACNGCGSCCSGCPRRAKNTLDYNYLALAERHGARIATAVEVKKIVQCPDETWELLCVDHLAGRRRSYRAQYVFLCAGSIHSTRLLRGARLRTTRGRRSRQLAGAGYFPGADALGIVYDAANPQYPSFGPTITTSTSAIDPYRRGSFFMIQDGGYAPAMARLAGVLRAPLWVGRNRVTRRGPSAVDPSWMTPPRSPPEPPPLTLSSPLDDVLTAITRGDFHKVATPKLRAEWKSFLRELKAPALLRPIVVHTIEAAVDEAIRRSSLTRWLNPNGAIARLLRRAQRWVIRKLYGSDSRFADRALEAVVTQAGLSRHQVAARILGYDARGAESRTVLLAMGRDAVAGALKYDGKSRRMIAELDLSRLARGYGVQQRLMADLARALGGELRVSPAWSFLGKPITVHNQGGCSMTDAEDGVTTPAGAVRGAKGLYVSDASVFPGSVGVNPSASILAIAEKNVLAFIREQRGPRWPDDATGMGAREYAAQRAAARAWVAEARSRNVTLEPPIPPPINFRARPVGVAFDEEMQGYYYPCREKPAKDAEFREMETLGRPDHPITFHLTLKAPDLSMFVQDDRHRMRAWGQIRVRLPDTGDELDYRCVGRVELLVRHLRSPDRTRREGPTGREQRFMTYRLWLRDRVDRRWLVKGYKRIRPGPGLHAWRDTSSLFLSLWCTGPESKRVFRGAGVARVDLERFLFAQLPSVRATGVRRDGTRALWAKWEFAAFFFGTLQRIYLPEVKRAIDALFKPNADYLLGDPARLRR